METLGINRESNNSIINECEILEKLGIEGV